MCGSSSMVERQLPKLNVAGSSPVFRSKKKPPVETQEAFSIVVNKSCVYKQKSPLRSFGKASERGFAFTISQLRMIS